MTPEMQILIGAVIYGIICFGLGFYYRPRVDAFFESIRSKFGKAFGPKTVKGPRPATKKAPVDPATLVIKKVGVYNIDDHDFDLIIKPGIDDYDRDLYDPGTTTRLNGNWSPREQVLIRDSLVEVTVTNNKITAGQWKCPYTGQTFLDPKQIDVDHIVPLAESWICGAKLWNKKQRNTFCRDLENLIAVSSEANREKGRYGPDKWMPYVKTIETQRWYIQRWLYTKKKYNLGMSESEILAMSKYAL